MGADQIFERFGDSSSNSLTPEAFDTARVNQAELRTLILDLAGGIDRLVPDSRSKSLALTALEDVQMRSNRAIFGNLL